MKKNHAFPASAFMLLFILIGCSHFSFGQQQKIKVLVITGGHGFQREPFYEVFNSIPSITYDTLIQPQANALITSPEVNRYDVLVFYDLFDSISPAQQERSEEHTSELQSPCNLVCRLLLEKKKNNKQK